MTSRHEILHRLKSLGDIANIMSSMKNLSVLEAKKLSHFQTTQARILQSYEDAAESFLAWYPLLKKFDGLHQTLILLLGSEHGFCSDYNDALLRAWNEYADNHPVVTTWAIGRKLCDQIPSNVQISPMQGPSVAEEIPTTLSRISEHLSRQLGITNLVVISHQPNTTDVQIKSILPPFMDSPPLPAHTGYPPHLNLEPEIFFQKMVENYMIAVLHGLFFDALLAEHRRRVQHLEGALERIDEKREQFLSRSNELRQWEITEEIEIIMLSAEDAIRY